MKTCIFSLCLLGLTNLLYAQNDFAMVTPNVDHTTTYNKIDSQNSQYLKYMALQPIAVRIKKLQTLVANYDVTAQPIYSSNKAITYTVVFETQGNYIKAIYDYTGTIINCEEHYVDVRIPYSISGHLAKEYPDWEFSKIYCTIEYAKNKQTILAYKVKLKKGNSSKTVRVEPLKLNTIKTE